MSLVTQLVGFGLRQVIGDYADNVVEMVEQRFRDHSGTLPKALDQAHNRAWQALGVALAGDGLVDRVKVFFASGDDKGVREQVQVFLTSNTVSFEGAPAEFRQSCLDELKRLRKSGLLSTQAGSAADIARQAAGFKRHADPQGLIEESRRAVAGVADALAEGYPNLSRLLRTPTPAGPPLLAAAFCYFFRREVETDDELAHGLFFDGLRQLSASQAKAFGAVGKALNELGERFDKAIEEILEGLERTRLAAEEAAKAAAAAEKAAAGAAAAASGAEKAAVATQEAVLDLHVEVQRLGGMNLAHADEFRSLIMQVIPLLSQAGMQRGEVRPANSCSIRGEDERRAVKALLARFRRLPAEEQRQAPALLNGLGKLQVGAGDFAEARQTFTEVVQVVGDASGKAEASFNAYRAALEENKWEAALAALSDAASHDPQRFAPFPLHRYEPQRILGAGGFGTAILCHDRNFDEDVVVKTLHAADLARGVDDVFREARILHKLQHPAIIGVRDCEYAVPALKARPYLVMDYFPGGTLQQFVEQRGPLNLELLLSMAVQTAEAMKAAHDQGVLHRDLKPANLLVRKEGDRLQVRIIDFGLALRQQTVDTSRVRSGSSQKSVLDSSVAGTLDYAPPEQLGKLPGVQPGPYSDLFAFARTCWYGLFKATEPQRRQWDSLPGPLADLLEACLKPDPQERPRGFEPVLAALGECSRAGQATGGKEQEERLRREQEEEQRRQKEGEEQLRQLVRAAVERTGGKSTPDYRTAAKELCRRYKLPADRANAIIRDVTKDVRRREEQERPPAPAPPISLPLAIAMPDIPLAEASDAGVPQKLAWVVPVPEKQERDQAPARKSRKDMVGQRKPSISPRRDALAGDENPPARPKKKGLPLVVWLLGGGGLLIMLWLCGGFFLRGLLSSLGGLLSSRVSTESSGVPTEGHGLPSSGVSTQGPVSQANFDRIKSGMTQAEVQAILGRPDTDRLYNPNNNRGFATWYSAGDQDYITVYFTNGRAVGSTYSTKKTGEQHGFGFDDAGHLTAP